jgi:hypothetical protein
MAKTESLIRWIRIGHFKVCGKLRQWNKLYQEKGKKSLGHQVSSIIFKGFSRVTPNPNGSSQLLSPSRNKQ